MKVFIKTFGCRTNIYDSEQLASYLNAPKNCQIELINTPQDADVVVINGCTVTNSADASTAAFVRQIKRMNKNTKIVLTGCGAAAAAGKALYESEQISGILGAEHKERAAELLLQAASGARFYEPGNKKFVEKSSLSSFSHHTKAFVKIQEGCDFNCSYCIIPAVRGRSRSLKAADILAQCREFIAHGHSELVLTGTNMGSYSHEQGGGLGKLLAQIGALPGLRRVRLGSLESAQIDEEFLELITEPWLERHLHIALQHTHDEMLQLMRRRNTALGDLALFERLADAGYALGSDFIVGHPGESEQIWREAMENFAKYPLTHIHAFIYSKRSGTHSVRLCEQLGEVPHALAKERLAEITQKVAHANARFCAAHAEAKTPLLVLIEQLKNGYLQGYDQFYNQIKLPSNFAKTANFPKNRANSEIGEVISQPEDLLKRWVEIEEFSLEQNEIIASKFRFCE